jgi:hypothetical protein
MPLQPHYPLMFCFILAETQSADGMPQLIPLSGGGALACVVARGGFRRHAYPRFPTHIISQNKVSLKDEITPLNWRGACYFCRDKSNQKRCQR